MSGVVTTPLRRTSEMRRETSSYSAPSLVDIKEALYISIVRDSVFQRYSRWRFPPTPVRLLRLYKNAARAVSLLCAHPDRPCAKAAEFSRNIPHLAFFSPQSPRAVFRGGPFPESSIAIRFWLNMQHIRFSYFRGDTSSIYGALGRPCWSSAFFRHRRFCAEMPIHQHWG